MNNNSVHNKTKVEISSVKGKVETTRKELEELKHQFEQLLKENIKVSDNNQVLEESRITVEKCPDAQVNCSEPQVPQSNQSPKTSPKSPNITKAYNVKEAREFIRKQREKRAQQLKCQITSKNQSMDIKKQKLRELHEKAKEIVATNVQLKRERSKSRDPDVVRLDRTNKGSFRGRSISRERPVVSKELKRGLKPKQNPENLRPNLLNVPDVKICTRLARSRSRDPANSTLKIKTNELNNCEAVNKNITFRQKVEDVQKSVERKQSTELVNEAQVSEISHKNITIRQQNSSNSLEVPKTDLDETKRPHFPSITIRKNSPKPESEKSSKLAKNILIIDTVHKETKETQTSQINSKTKEVVAEIPIAIQDPYNFINAVKQKLAIYSHKYNDVGIQSSLPSTPEPNLQQTKEKIKEILDKSANNSNHTNKTCDDFNSFASHRNLNLDLAAVDKLQLIHNQNKSDDLVSKRLLFNDESESDTSKNIPEISSESGVSSRTNTITTNSDHYLDLEAVQSLTLQTANSKSIRLKLLTDNPIVDENYSEQISNKYSSDFVEDIKSSGFNTRSDSLISTAISSYTENKKRNNVSDIEKDAVCENSNSKQWKNSKSKTISEAIPKDSNNSYKITDDENSKSLVDDPLFELLQKSTNLDSNKNLNNTVLLKQPSLSLSLKESCEAKEIEDELQSTINSSTSKSDTELKNQEKSSSSSSVKDDSTSTNNKLNSTRVLKNIILEPIKNNNVNEIHLKFEAEVHLLNDFNESLKQFMAAEEAFDHLKKKNDVNMSMTKILQNIDTQTSFIGSGGKSSSFFSPSKSKLETVQHSREHSFINYSRGSEIEENEKDLSKFSDTSISINMSLMNESGKVSEIDTNDKNNLQSLKLNENQNVNCAGLSLTMFEQLIKDEDARLEHLKTIIKIRERALLDRTKSELVWLDVHKKQLLETGKFEEASLIKKRQRAILVKHEQERNEMKRLQQTHKKVTNERINELKRQRNLIKTQLSTETMLTNIKVNSSRERRHSGPLVVVHSHTTESIHSETSTRHNSIDGVLSVSSHTTVSRLSVDSDLDSSTTNEHNGKSLSKLLKMPVSNVKRTLLMREAALQKRRKAAEELLKWHQELLDEEKKIIELEATAITLVKQKHNKKIEPNLEPYKFRGKQLNQLWKNMTGRDDKQFVDDKIHVMSQMTLERFCKSARNKNRKKLNNSGGDLIKILNNNQISNANSVVSELSDNVQDIPSISGKNQSVSEEIPTTNGDYTSEFETESVQEAIHFDEKSQISSISELINNFSKIEDEISILSKKSKHDHSIFNDIEPEKFNEIISEPLIIRDKKFEPSDVDSISSEVSSEIHSQINASEEKNNNLNENLSNPSLKSSSLLLIEEDVKQKSDTTPKLSQIIENHKVNGEKASEISENVIDVEETNVSENSINTILSNNKQVSKNNEIVKEKNNSHSPVLSESDDNKLDASLDSKILDEILDEADKNDSSSIKSITETDSSSQSKKANEKLCNGSEISLVQESKKISEKSIQNSVEEISQNISSITEETNTDLDSTKSNIGFIPDDVQTNKSDSELIKSITQNENQNETSTLNYPTLKNDLSKLVISLEKESIPKESILESESSTLKQLSSDELLSEKEQQIEEKEEDTLISITTKSVVEDEDEYSNDFKSESNKTTFSEKEQSKSCGEKQEKTLSNSSAKLTNASSICTPSLITSELEMPSQSVNIEKEDCSSIKSPRKIDVKKRVSEILADANNGLSRSERSPRLQDIYMTTYDIASPTSPDVITPPEDGKLSSELFGNEAEELLRKQIAIEQEIKQLERQQKEQLPYVYMREIPNKPPPPYTPPTKTSSVSFSVLPSDPKEIDQITNYTSKVLYKAYQSNNLSKVKFSESSFKLVSTIDIGKNCCELLFNICKELAQEHYKQFEKVEGPSWRTVGNKSQLTISKPLDGLGLNRYMNKKLKALFGFQKLQIAESAIIKWGRKKRDHVDEILVRELQEEELQWTNFETEELVIKEQLNDEIWEMLIDETADFFKNYITKKSTTVN